MFNFFNQRILQLLNIYIVNAHTLLWLLVHICFYSSKLIFVNWINIHVYLNKTNVSILCNSNDFHTRLFRYYNGAADNEKKTCVKFRTRLSRSASALAESGVRRLSDNPFWSRVRRAPPPVHSARIPRFTRGTLYRGTW